MSTPPTGRPRGRPPLDPADLRTVRLTVTLTEAEAKELDRRRAAEAAATCTKPSPRSEWLVTAAGLRS